MVQIAIGLSFFLVTLSGMNMTNENWKDEMEDPESDLSKSALVGRDEQDSEQFSVSIYLWCVHFSIAYWKLF